jgi:UDP-N-acetylmuramoylalanine--D-glutamate ligase
MNDASLTVILGFGVTGQSVARHLAGRGQGFAVIDTRPPPDQILPAAGEYYWQCDSWPHEVSQRTAKVVVSPGLSPQHPLVEQARHLSLPICTDIDLFLAMTDVPVIGVTGTNGKSTVVSLVGHLLQNWGFACGVGGNLGPPALDLLSEEAQFYVLELSSFQLAYSGGLELASAGVLNIGDDHLDWHGSAASYAAAKCRIYDKAQYRVGATDVVSDTDVALDAWISGSKSVQGDAWGIKDRQGETWICFADEPLMSASELPLSGRHNIENCLWALALVKPWIEPSKAVEQLANFAPLPHRFVSVPGPVHLHCIDDSKATNVGATMAALEGFEGNQSLILIAGGDSKDADLTPLGAAMEGRVRVLFTLGVDAPRINHIAQQHGVAWHQVETMDEAVDAAIACARSGDTLLLSPACASLDMYDNFSQRGDHFAASVNRYLDFQISGVDLEQS